MPAAPSSTDWRVWAASFAIAIGWGAQVIDFRADTADCMDEHRKAGDIR